MQYRDEQLLYRLGGLKTFHGWPSGMLDIWVRSKADLTDRFDDKVYTYDCTSGEPKFKIVCGGTSNAGTFGLYQFRTYNPLGCAVLCGDTIVYDSHKPGLHKGKDAYVQRIGFPYTRDNDKDGKAENYGKIYNDMIGANCHRAGTFSQVIYNWSIACLVRCRLSEFKKWRYEIMQGKLLTVAILNEF